MDRRLPVWCYACRHVDCHDQGLLQFVVLAAYSHFSTKFNVQQRLESSRVDLAFAQSSRLRFLRQLICLIIIYYCLINSQTIAYIIKLLPNLVVLFTNGANFD